MKALASIVLGEVALTRVGAKYGVGVADLRLLGAIALLSAGGGRPTYAGLVTLLDQTGDATVRRGVARLVARRYVTKQKGHGRLPGGGSLGLRLEPAGASLVGIIEREERAARASIVSVEVGRWKRKYVRSGRFVGQHAKQQAAREAKQALAGQTQPGGVLGGYTV